MLKTAMDVNAGKLLFSETFSQYGFFTPYWHSFFLDTFDGKYIGLQFSTAISYGVAGFFLVLAWSHFVRSKLLLLLAGLVYVFISPFSSWSLVPWPSVYALMTQAVCLYLGILYFKKRKIALMFGAGVFMALTFGFRWPVGFFGFASISTLFLVSLTSNLKNDFKKPFLSFGVGFFIVLLPYFSWLWQQGLLSDYWKQTMLLPIAYFKVHGGAFFPLFNLFVFRDLGVWFLLPFVLILLTLIYGKKYFKKNLAVHHFKLLFFIFIGLASWLQYHPEPCKRHTYWAAAPLIGLFFYYFESRLRYLFYKRRSLIGKKYIISIAILFLGMSQVLNFANLNMGLMRKKRRFFKREYVKLEKPEILKGTYVDKKDASVILGINSEVEKINNDIVLHVRDAGNFVYKGSSLSKKIFLSWKYIDDIYPERKSQRASFFEDKKPTVIIDRVNRISEFQKEIPCYTEVKAIGGMLYKLDCPSK